jgi:hypothetical protein
MLRAPGQPDLAATETAIGVAVAATGTALARTLPAQPGPTSVPATATVASLNPAVAAKPTSAGTPIPAATRTGAALTSAEAAYLRGAVSFISQFNMSFDRFAELIRQAKPEETSWRVALNTELRLWAEGAEAVRSAQPPDSMQPIHRHVLAGAEAYREAARLITEALQQGDSDQVRRGLEAVQQGRRSLAEATREIERIAQERGL